MLKKLNVKMLILNDEQEVIHSFGAFNELISSRDYFCTSTLH